MIWYILAAMALVIFGALSASVGVRVSYGEEEGLGIKMRIRFFGIPVYRRRLYPAFEKPKRIRIKNYSSAALEKKKRREERRRAKEKAKAEKKKKKQKQNGEARENAPGKKSFADKVRLVKHIARISLVLLKKFGAMTKIKINALRITVGGGDAASTAISYGLISQGVAYLTEILSHFADFKTKRDDSIAVNADFLSEETSAEIDIRFSTRVCKIIGLAVSAIVLYLKK